MADDIAFPSPSTFLAPDTPPTATRDASPPNAEAKKKTSPRRSSAMKNAPSTSPLKPTVGDKPKQSKSRNGCSTCKAKRLKCDEAKPACEQCRRRKVECGGYKREFKWRSFDIQIKTPGEGAERVVSSLEATPNPAAKHSSPTETSPTGSVDVDVSPGRRRDSKRPSSEHEGANATEPSTRPVKATRKERSPRKNVQPAAEPPTSVAVAEQQVSPDSGLPPASAPPQDGNISLLTLLPSVPVDSAPSPAPLNPQTLPCPLGGASPTLTELLLPFDDGIGDHPAGFIPFSMPEDMQFPLISSPSSASVIDTALLIASLADEEVEELVREDGTIASLPAATLVDQTTPSTQLRALWSAPANYHIHSQPYFAEDSPEMLAFRFDKLTCGILSIMDGRHENPWRTLIWPLAQESPALYNAIMAMTAYHSSIDVPGLRVVGHEHKQKSIRYIQEGIRDRSMTDQTAIATALALGFSESWDQHTASGNTHIKGAQALVKRALSDHALDPLSGIELARLKFLCNAWVYMDVIARLTSVDSDESHDFDNTFLFSLDAPNMIMGDNVGNPGFGIDFGIGVDSRLDPLMGCANTLFPLIGRVANLVRRVCRSQTNSPSVISQAHDLRVMLETWEPPSYIEQPDDPTTGVQHTLQTAQAYRWATLLHLHQSVPELPSEDNAWDLAQKVLQFLATVPLASRTVIVQIYPLMVAGCEAETTEDRNWVRDRWKAMGQRMRIGVIDKSAAVTEEVWRRRDRYKAQPTEHRRLVATAELQSARRRGVPLTRRTNSNASPADPGNLGMVFSYVEGGESADLGATPASAGGGGSGGGGGGGGAAGVGSAGIGGIANDRFPARPARPDRGVSTVDPAYTVRGHLHWVGVMWDWGWEVLLG